jgi:hypothetical protein
MIKSDVDGIIDKNIDLTKFRETDKTQPKESTKSKTKDVNFRLSRILEGLLVWYSKKIELTDEQIESEIKFDEPDKDLFDSALNPLISKVVEMLGLDDNEVFAVVMLITVIAPRILFILSQKKKEPKKEVIKNE